MPEVAIVAFEQARVESRKPISAQFTSNRLPMRFLCHVAARITRSANGLGCFIGNYELFQWSYLNDRNVMKTNISVRRTGKKTKKVQFEESVVSTSQRATITGTVELVHTNMFFYGRCNDVFQECEVVIVNIPRMKLEWLTGVVAGVSSDRYLYPSASRVAMHYMADAPHPSGPLYAPMSSIDLPQEIKDYLTKIPNPEHPILSSRG